MALRNKKTGEGQAEGAPDGGARETTVAQAGTTQQQEEPQAAPAAAEPAGQQEPEESGRAKRKRERGERGTSKPVGEVVAKTRTRVAHVVWLLFVLAALVLAIGALCIALGANKGNGAVQFVLDGAKALDLGIFSRQNGIKTFDGDNAAVKNALFNWGIAAVLYLVVGRIVERIIRP